MSKILEYEEQLKNAMLNSDLIALDKLISKDLKFTLPNGVVISKDDDLSNYQNKLQNITNLDFKNIEILEISEGIVGTLVTVDLKGTFGENDISGSYQYSRVWKKSEEGYQVILGQVCLIQA